MTYYKVVQKKTWCAILLSMSLLLQKIKSQDWRHKSCLKLDWTLQCTSSVKVPQTLVFPASQNPIHLFSLPTCSVCHLFSVKTLSDSKDLLWGARRGPGYASDHHCMRGIWWHKAWVMWYCHQSAVTCLARSRQTPPRPSLTASRAAAGQGTATHIYTRAHTPITQWQSLKIQHSKGLRDSQCHSHHKGFGIKALCSLCSGDLNDWASKQGALKS